MKTITFPALPRPTLEEIKSFFPHMNGGTVSVICDESMTEAVVVTLPRKTMAKQILGYQHGAWVVATQKKLSGNILDGLVLGALILQTESPRSSSRLWFPRLESDEKNGCLKIGWVSVRLFGF